MYIEICMNNFYNATVFKHIMLICIWEDQVSIDIFQIEKLQFVGKLLRCSGISPEIFLLPSERAGPK